MLTSSPPRSTSERASIIECLGPKPVAGLLSTLALLFAGIAWAGTFTLTARVSVNTNCSVAAAAVAFGTYDPITANAPSGANLNATGSITITCVKGTAPTIDLSAGAHPSGTSPTRQMLSGAANFLAYELYQPPNNTPGTACTFTGTVWGTAVGGSSFSPAAAPDKTARVYNICGTAARGQDPAIGVYADAVVATVTF